MIRLENLSINIENNKLLIANINIFIPSGFLISIIGEPASGKTRLSKVLGLQEKAAVGNIHILGKNTNKLNRNEQNFINPIDSPEYQGTSSGGNLEIPENTKVQKAQKIARELYGRYNEKDRSAKDKRYIKNLLDWY